jgi:hypothetical protein
VARINVCTNLTNGVGLQRDYEMLRAELEKRGYEVNGIMWNAKEAPRADLNIFIELLNLGIFQRAPRQWAIPNPEWWFAGWDVNLPQIESVLCKTHDCERIFRGKGPKTRYIGWQARDLYRPEIQRERKVLHLAGKSHAKNTEAVVECWRRYSPEIDLTVVSEHFVGVGSRTSSYRRVTEEQLTLFLNSHLFHLLPSAYEGYGHAIHEAQAVGAILMTTDAAPMDEAGAPVRLPSCRRRNANHAPYFDVSPEAIRDGIERALAMSEEEIRLASEAARAKYEADCAEFQASLNELFGKAIELRAATA